VSKIKISFKFQAALSKSQKKRLRKKQTKPEGPEGKAQPEDRNTENIQHNIEVTPKEPPPEVKKEVISKQEASAKLPKELPQQIKLERVPEQPVAAQPPNPKSDEICKVEQSEVKPSPVIMEDAEKSREAIMAARQAKKAAKKNKEDKKDKPKPATPAASDLKTQVAPPVKTTPVSAGKENKAQTPMINQESKATLIPSQKSSKEAENKASAEQTQKSSKEVKEERRLKQVF
jgi:hypothetical protein